MLIISKKIFMLFTYLYYNNKNKNNKKNNYIIFNSKYFYIIIKLLLLKKNEYKFFHNKLKINIKNYKFLIYCEKILTGYNKFSFNYFDRNKEIYLKDFKPRTNLSLNIDFFFFFFSGKYLEYYRIFKYYENIFKYPIKTFNNLYDFNIFKLYKANIINEQYIMHHCLTKLKIFNTIKII